MPFWKVFAMHTSKKITVWKLYLSRVLHFPPKYLAEKEEFNINGSIMVLKSDK